ncbi:MAG: S9 family peptidase [Caulobacterales bacterium]|nr:S9 family peptidase [Caulobacterales bacterium]
MKALVSAVLGLMALAVFTVAPAQAAAPPVSAFARLPAIEQATISPDGARVALLGGPPGERIIFLAPVDGQSSVTVKLGQAWVHSVRWVSNEYLVVNFSMLDKGTNYSNGQQWSYQLNRNVVINREGKLVSYLLADTDWSGYAISQPILGVLEGATPTVLIQGLDLSADTMGYKPDSLIQPKGDDLIAAIWAVDVTTGRGRIADRGNRMTQSWELDLSGDPRVRWDYDGEMDEMTFSVRPKGKSGWAHLDIGEGDQAFSFLGYSDPDDSIYLSESGPDGVRLLRRRLADGATTPVALQGPVQALELIWDPYTLTPVAIATQTDKPAYQWLEPGLGAVQAKLSRAFAGKDVYLSSWSKDRTRVVVRVAAPSSPPAWYLFDTRTNQASALGESYPELAGAALGTTSWITYKARDGKEISAYLTLPPGLAPGAKPPLIVFPHGGPAVRDDFDFDWWVQAMATRGYAVLQPQFRGSSGFGEAFEQAGNEQWGGKMQDDLIDGVLALADQGVADAKRVCIVGASYGGYAALYGASVYPSVYRCGASVNGVSDLALLIGSKSRAFGRDTALVNALETMMGDPREKAEAYRLASPVFRVTRQAAPILLIHGEDDTTVPIQQSRTMQRALKANGFAGDLVVLKDDDHHLSSTASRQLMLDSLFAFLDRHLPVGP